MNTTGNTILITGGGSGIGRGLAEAFHKLGNTVIITGRTKSKLDDVTKANAGMKSFVVDVDDPAAIKSFATEAVKQFPKLNVVINNAGAGKGENLADGTTDVAEATITTNLLGPIRLNAALLPHLTKQPNGAVINVTSGLAFVPMAMMASYCLTKAALHSYSESLRYQLKDTPIKVLEIIPPYVQTHFGGEKQANDPRAMPLKDFIEQTMAVLKTDANEVIVDQCKPLRDAEKDGTYEKMFGMIQGMAETL